MASDEDSEIENSEMVTGDYDKLRNEQLPWTEKYRPRNLNELTLELNLKSEIKKLVSRKNIPNLILTGSSGIGKTSTIKVIARELYGNYASSAVLELNASDDRGIKLVQVEIINFCKTKLSYPDGQDSYAKYKLIILDEADNMVDRAQPQINTIMEQYKDTVRFAFTCNSSANIIESIQSRCLILRYMRLNKELIANRLKEISDIEKIKYDEKAFIKIGELCHGDMRSAVNMLQLIYNNKGKIKCEYIDELCDLPQQMIIKKLFNNVIKKDLTASFEIMYELKNSGYSGSDITLGMLHTLKAEICNDIPEAIKVNLFNCICMGAYRISKGIDSTLQLASCIVDMVKCCS